MFWIKRYNICLNDQYNTIQLKILYLKRQFNFDKF